MALNYFVCTLGQAASDKAHSGTWRTVNELVDWLNEHHPNSPAAGFAYPKADTLTREHRTILYTFSDIFKGSQYVVKRLVDGIAGDIPAQHSTVALLSSSTPEFLFTWLALIRMGLAVLLIAPQNQPDAITHLCKTCDVRLLVYDGLYGALAKDAIASASSNGCPALRSLQIPFSAYDEGFKNALHEEVRIKADTNPCSPDDVAYLFHTSGTSSGLPKPIRQTHHGAVQVLPSFPDGWQRATYSTTPLYHGGISDLFRAWSSHALMWLFPGKQRGVEKNLSITSSNIISCIEVIETQRQREPPTKYFTSVPYILQMMASNNNGLQKLQTMDCVGVGGASLPNEIGDQLVEQGINLTSRYGSAECGFLLSSHRDYDKDKAWQFLRADTGVDHIDFEPREEGKFEVVVRQGWPHMSKTNRDDGSYATSDLMVAHPSIQNAWRYDSRADSQLTLITGKKFDPAPLEDSIASLPFLDDVLIFGNGQPFPGALLFRSEQSRQYSDEDLIPAVAPHFEQLNVKSQSHARIPRNMLVPVKHEENRLQKSSKGTLLRKKAEETYRTLIASAYDRLGLPSRDAVPDSEVLKSIQDAVAAIVSGEHIGAEDDLFAHGVDSLGSIQIRHAIRRLIPSGHGELPITIVEDCGTIARLSEFVLRCRHGNIDSTKDRNNDEIGLMHELVERHGSFSAQPHKSPQQVNGTSAPHSKTVLLTGATGALGAHLLSQYRSDPGISHIYCLVRGADAHAAIERVQKSLTSRKLPTLSAEDNKASILPCKLSEPSLGLTEDQYNQLQQQVSLVIHAAWSVNFRWRLSSFEKDHIAGTRHLLDLCLTSSRENTPSFVFCSSIASVSATSPSHTNTPAKTVPVPEVPSTNAADASYLGYSRSKWVTEAILSRAAQARPDINIQILRIGQLSGDTVNGIWNTSEAWPLVLGTVSVTGCLPDLKTQSLDWLAVDVAANAVIELATSESLESGGMVNVRHVLNPDHSVTWTDALRWMTGCGEELEVLEPVEWMQRLEGSENEGKEHSALRLSGMWRKRYAVDSGSEDEGRSLVFDVSKTEKVSPSLRAVKPVDEEYFKKLWTWVKENVH